MSIFSFKMTFCHLTHMNERKKERKKEERKKKERKWFIIKRGAGRDQIIDNCLINSDITFTAEKVLSSNATSSACRSDVGEHDSAGDLRVGGAAQGEGTYPRGLVCTVSAQGGGTYPRGLVSTVQFRVQDAHFPPKKKGRTREGFLGQKFTFVSQDARKPANVEVRVVYTRVCLVFGIARHCWAGGDGRTPKGG